MRNFMGTKELLRLAWRQDRIMIPAWVLSLVATAAVSAKATVGVYPTVTSRVAAAQAINGSQALVALYGKIYDVTSLGSIATIKLVGFGSVFVALLGVLLVTRHTRAEEEAGRLELLYATEVGRYAALTAALVVSFGTMVGLSVLTAIALIASGLSTSGSVAFGLVWLAVGSAFAALAAVCVQLVRNSRTANSIAVTVLGISYVARAIGDTGPQWASWLSPVGWAQQLRPYAGDRLWVVALPVAWTVAFVVGGYALLAHRDHDAGVFADRAGVVRANRSLRSPFALAWRLQRGALLGWVVGLLVLGLVLGSIATNLGGMLNGTRATELITKLGGTQKVTEAFLSAELGIVAIMATVYGMQVVFRMRVEETALRAEPLLATGVSRLRWWASQVSILVLGTSALLVAVGIGAGFSYPAGAGRVLLGALTQLPAIWVLGGVAVAVFGYVPRLMPACWGVLGFVLLLGEFGALLNLPQWVVDVSPYAHSPRISDLTVTPVAWLTLLAVGLLAAGAHGFRRRDVA